MKKTALITGITGQDGSYLAELLINKGYEVHGVKRYSSSYNTRRVEHLEESDGVDSLCTMYYGDLTDSSNLSGLICKIKPDEIYNLGAQSHVRVSFDTPEYTAEVNALGTLRLLEAVKNCGLADKTRFYQASSSELYGLVKETPQKETTPFYPRSPYACAKLYAYWTVVNYRESYQMFACNGILFNHESPRRGDDFVTRKVTKAATRIKLGLQDKLYLGNLNAKRDWGHAKDYVEGMWMMLQQDKPDDYILATGVNATVRHFVELTFSELGIDIEWQGSGISEKGINKASGDTLIEINPKYIRPAEVDSLLGDASKAHSKLGWYPKYDLNSLVKEMVREDYNQVQKSLDYSVR